MQCLIIWITKSLVWLLYVLYRFEQKCLGEACRSGKKADNNILYLEAYMLYAILPAKIWIFTLSFIYLFDILQKARALGKGHTYSIFRGTFTIYFAR